MISFDVTRKEFLRGRREIRGKAMVVLAENRTKHVERWWSTLTAAARKGIGGRLMIPL